MMVVTPTKTPPKKSPRTCVSSSVLVKGRLPHWSDLDNIWGDALLEACEEFRAERERRAALAIADDVGGGP